MSEKELDTEDNPVEGGLLGRARSWVAAHPKRSLLAGALMGVVGVTTIAAWVVLASLTAPHHTVTLDDALEALDNGDLEYAEELVLRIQSQGTLTHQDIGGPLFVLGAVKAARADQEFSVVHRRQGYLVASGYLSKAKEAGFPVEREHQGLYLLGKSLIKSNQLQRGVEVLREALSTNPEHVEDIHRLIAEAYFYSERPVYSLVLDHLDQALASEGLEEADRNEANILKAQTLAAVGRYDDAFQTLEEVKPTGDLARKLLVEGQIRVDQLQSLFDPSQEPTPATEELLKRAEETLQRAWNEDKLAIRSGTTKFLFAQLQRLQGNAPGAIQRFEEVHQSHGQEPEGVAAAMAQGQMYQQRGDDEDAVRKYRIALDSVNDPLNYRSELLPLSRLRSQTLAAHSSFIAAEKFQAAADLVERLYPVFSHNRQLEIKAATYSDWGRHLLHQSEAEGWSNRELAVSGRAKLREAGLNYEILADARFATKHYPEHLWQACEAYYLGQSYSSALRTVRKYLKNEPLQRNALALLRLGQTRLAMGDPPGAAEAFEECIEFHPLDAATYNAKLECAKAFREMGDPDHAEALLLQNLRGSTLSPDSPEWRDSKFELGRLLYEHQQFDQAIEHLEEAILRYPDDRQTRLAKYLVAEAYRHAADEPMRLYQEAKTVNERERNRKEVQDYLETALDNYEKVRREIAVLAAWSEVDRAMIRNCYMFKGAVLFQQGVLEQDEAERALKDGKQDAALENAEAAKKHLASAVQAYSDLSAQFQDEPIILEVLVQIATCWRRLEDQRKARGQIDRALGLLEQLPRDTDFASTTNLSRNEWEAMLNQMKDW